MGRPSKTTSALRDNEELWQKIKAKWLKGDKGGVAGKWNARKAQLAVLEYKRRGGGYLGRKRRNNSLAVWTREDWGYVDGDTGGRYLPAGVRRRLTPRQRAATNRGKKRVGKGRVAPWEPAVAEAFRKNRLKVLN